MLGLGLPFSPRVSQPAHYPRIKVYDDQIGTPHNTNLDQGIILQQRQNGRKEMTEALYPDPTITTPSRSSIRKESNGLKVVTEVPEWG